MSEPVTGTIFDPDLPPAETDPHRHQRICGLFVLHGINPMQVRKGSAVVLPLAGDAGKVEVSFLAVIPSTTAWASDGPRAVVDGHRLPGWSSVMCQHEDGTHVAVIKDSFIATWDEVAL